MPPARIMYIENKSDRIHTRGIVGPAVIGRVTFSQSGRTLYYNGKKLRKVGNGYKYNHIDMTNGDRYWISGPKKDGNDGLYGYRATPIDQDVREEYWTQIREQPKSIKKKSS